MIKRLTLLVALVLLLPFFFNSPVRGQGVATYVFGFTVQQRDQYNRFYYADVDLYIQIPQLLIFNETIDFIASIDLLKIYGYNPQGKVVLFVNQGVFISVTRIRNFTINYMYNNYVNITEVVFRESGTGLPILFVKPFQPIDLNKGVVTMTPALIGFYTSNVIQLMGNRSSVTISLGSPEVIITSVMGSTSAFVTRCTQCTNIIHVEYSGAPTWRLLYIAPYTTTATTYVTRTVTTQQTLVSFSTLLALIPTTYTTTATLVLTTTTSTVLATTPPPEILTQIQTIEKTYRVTTTTTAYSNITTTTTQTVMTTETRVVEALPPTYYVIVGYAITITIILAIYVLHTRIQKKEGRRAV
jgi:hypothetical protein